MREITDEDIKKEINEYIKKIEYLSVKANTKSKKRMLMDTMYSLSGIHNELFSLPNIKFNYDYMHNIYPKFFSFYDNVSENLPFLGELSRSVIEIFAEEEYPFYKRFPSVDYISLEDILELVKEFFSTFNDPIINNYKEKLKGNKIYTYPLKSDYAGIIFPLAALKKYIICINTDYQLDLYFASSFCHELGHAYEKELFYTASGSYLNDKYNDTILYEVVSSFFEYAFINYLKDNNYYKENIDSEFNKYFKGLFHYGYNVNIFDLMKNFQVDGYKVILNKKDVMDRVEVIKNRINYYERFPKYQDSVHFVDNIIYFIGQLLAINLYDKYKQNPKEFMKNFRTSLVNYPRTGSINSFEVVGITKKDLLSGKVLKRELEKFIKD